MEISLNALIQKNENNTKYDNDNNDSNSKWQIWK